MSSAVEVLTRSELDELLEVSHPRDIAGLEELGYTLVGGVRYRIRGREGRAALMMGPARDREASVVATPSVTMFVISSVSEEGRVLRSRNGPIWEAAPWELCNDLPGATPRQLDLAHSHALEEVRDIFEPRIRPEGEAVEEIADGMRGRLRSIEALNLIYRGGGGYGVLSKDARSVRRIERWASTEPPPHS